MTPLLDNVMDLMARRRGGLEGACAVCGRRVSGDDAQLKLRGGSAPVHLRCASFSASRTRDRSRVR